MNSTELFALALGLGSPWKLDNVELISSLKGSIELHIYIGFEKGSKFPDSNNALCPVYDTKERTWQHLNFFQHECYLHCKVPRIQTLIDGKTKVSQVNVPWARENSGFTLLFEAFAMQLIEYEMPVSKVADTMEVYPNRIWNIFNYWISKAYSEADHSGVKQLGFDETSTKKGHNYVTIGVDLETKAVVHAEIGKGADTIQKTQEYLESKSCPASQIEAVSIDLSPAFIAGVTESFPDAAITFDHFHVTKLLNEAVDQVFRMERKESDLLKKQRYTFLKGNSKLSQRQREERENLIVLFPKLGEAYRLKTLFKDFWEMNDLDEAQGFLMYWADMVKESKIQPLIKFTNTLFSHWSGIVNYINSRISNGILEGINSKIQLAKKRARGYRNINNFINMIYFIAGKLKFDYPHKRR